MPFVPLRTFPGLFVGRRNLVCAEIGAVVTAGSHYRCGACELPVLRQGSHDMRDTVVKCGCGAFNQL